MNVSCTQARKQRSNASGSISTSRRWNVSCKGGSPVTVGRCAHAEAEGSQVEVGQKLGADRDRRAGRLQAWVRCGRD